MSQPDFESVEAAPTVIKKKPQLNVYTMMLIVALISLLLACVFLLLELNEYGGYGAVQGRLSMLESPLDLAQPGFWV